MSSAVDAKYKIVFEDIRLRVAKVKVNLAIMYAQNQALTSTNAKYPFTQTIVQQTTISSGGTSYTQDNIFQMMRPNFVTVGFVKATAATGAYDQNLWYFNHYNVTSIGLYVDGIPVDGSPLKLDYNSNNGQTLIPVLTNMFKATGNWLTDSGIDLE